MAILDWMMPGMDGIQVCQAVRERNQDSQDSLPSTLWPSQLASKPAQHDLSTYGCFLLFHFIF
jgi:CheY-like chemotaxis protein